MLQIDLESSVHWSEDNAGGAYLRYDAVIIDL